jgi:hypothetical protein
MPDTSSLLSEFNGDNITIKPKREAAAPAPEPAETAPAPPAAPAPEKAPEKSEPAAPASGSEPPVSTPPAAPKTDAAPAAPAPEPDWLAITKGKASSVDQIMAALEAPKVEFADERVRLINELVKSGKTDLKGAIELQTKDFSKMTAVEVVREKERLENSTLSEEEFELYFDDKYKVSDFYDEREQMLGQIELRKAEAQARETMQSYQARELAAAPDPEAMRQDWENQVAAALPAITGLEFKLGNETVKYQPVAEDLAEVKQMLTDPQWMMRQYGKEDGTIDISRYAQDAFLMLPGAKERIFKSLLAQGASKGISQVEQQLKNPSTNVETRVPGRFDNEDDKLIDAMQNARRVRP